MTMLPDEVKLAVAADAARASVAPSDTGMAPAGRPAAAQQAGLSPVEMEYRRRQAAGQTLAAAQPADGRPDPVALFNRAREMQALNVMASAPAASPLPTAAEMPGQAPAAEDRANGPTPQDTWQAALAMNQARSRSGTPSTMPPQEPDREAVTAAVKDGPAPGDILEFVLSGDALTITEEDRMQLRLRALGGRKARRIVVGRLDGKGFEILSRAQDIARHVAEVTGGQPGMGYDPAMSAGAVRVEYEPFASGSR
ncbi:hypothetical protein CSC94_07025 [Zhengella mangrovi]|uniref:Uncharacterized protein n=1 Tax=Zhengella mangrovi TaxID=1982044 RepID=A0A2G1QPN7_9HYPH|nr:hypothetical protein [Zhengella mangrovi]PHP67455.1 hypothetical protein CSC94_07025 [Zhengella mangrovi]